MVETNNCQQSLDVALPFFALPTQASPPFILVCRHYLATFNMDGDPFSMPLAGPRSNSFSTRSTATKRDSLAAELERGPYTI